MDSLSILVVDDNQVHGVGLAELLEMEGFSAVFAITGSQALHLAASRSFDAVLLDIHLPDMSGYDVCRKLREDSRTANAAVIFHSGSHPPDKDGHHGDAFLTYPVEFSVLFNVIRGCVARRRAVTA
jgi:CheY-like chemotaxis protein